MAVARVFGRVDGTEVLLVDTGGGRWMVPVPFDQDGEYVAEIIAEDDAGNQSYVAKMLYVVNTALLCAHIVPIPYYAEVLPPAHWLSASGPRFYVELIVPECSQAERR